MKLCAGSKRFLLLLGLSIACFLQIKRETKVVLSTHDDISFWIPSIPAVTCQGKEPMMRELERAGIEITETLCQKLPLWQQVVDLYGKGPIVYGIETCERYRQSVQGKSDPRPKIAGLWNTGTTAFTTVPWGKHTPLRLKYTNTFPKGNPELPDQVLPVYMIRDPYRWMNSMCKARYGANWKDGHNGRCPNLIPTTEEKANASLAVYLNGDFFRFRTTNWQSYNRHVTNYDSLADLWTRFSRDYLVADFPRLIVRAEDAIFYPRELMQIIANCSGRPLKVPFEYYSDQGKENSNTTLATAMMKYGTAQGRVSTSLTGNELAYLQTALDPKLMALFHYPYHSAVESI